MKEYFRLHFKVRLDLVERITKLKLQTADKDKSGHLNLDEFFDLFVGVLEQIPEKDKEPPKQESETSITIDLDTSKQQDTPQISRSLSPQALSRSLPKEGESDDDDEEEQPQSNNQTLKRVSFSLQYDTKFGENLFIIGEGNELGNWDFNKGLRMAWWPGNYWSIETHLPVGRPRKFKYVVVELEQGPWHIVKEENSIHEIPLDLPQPHFSYEEPFDLRRPGPLV